MGLIPRRDPDPRLDPYGRGEPSGPLPAWARLMYRLRRPIGMMHLRREGHMEELKALGAATARAASGRPSHKVAVVELIGSPLAGATASVLANALRLRGCEVLMYACGGGQPICQVGWSRYRYPLPCNRCGAYTREVAHAGAFPLSQLRDGFPWGPDGRGAPSTLAPGNGSHLDHRQIASIGATQWYITSDFMSAPRGADVFEEFSVAAAGVEAAITKCIERDRPDTLLLRNGYYVAERAILDTARNLGVHVVSHECVYRPPARMFNHNRPAALANTDEAWELAKHQPLTPAEDAALDSYLGARESGEETYRRFYNDPVRGASPVRRHLGLQDHGRLITLFPNVGWDIACINRDVAFSSMLEWINLVIDLVEKDDQASLVIRSHPGELDSDSPERVDVALGARMNHPRLRLIAPDEAIDSYSLIDASDLVLTYTSMVGVEATIRGKPVVVAGDVHYRGKGFTLDVDSPAQLASLISDPPPPPPEAIKLARMYAFMFFFRLMIPLPGFELAPGVESWPENRVHRIPTAAELMPGANPYLDLVCERIVSREPFLLPTELALAAHAPSKLTQPN